MARYSYKKALTKLIDFAKNNGVKKINLDHNDLSYIVFDDIGKPKKIMIEGNNNYENKVYLLLHELGHCKLRANWEIFSETLPYLADVEYYNDKKSKKTINYIVSCIEEEFKAWEFGYNLAIELDIKINKVKWNNLKYTCLMSYINYYSFN
jgi:hypothetical protein